MKCLTSSILGLSLIAVMVYNNPAKAQVFNKDKLIFSIGYGAPYIFHIAPNENYTKTSPIGPIYFKAEYGITNHISIGINLAYVQIGVENKETGAFYTAGGSPIYFFTYTSKEAYTSVSILARANYHFLNYHKFDPYIGMGLGYRNGITTYQANYFLNNNVDLGTNTPIGFDLTIGAQYYISKTFGVYLELGAAKSPIQGGMVLKFNTAKKQVNP